MILDRILDWRMRGLLRKLDVPDLPEVRKMMRLAWWNGFTFGALEHQANAARREALEAIAAMPDMTRKQGKEGRP